MGLSMRGLGGMARMCMWFRRMGRRLFIMGIEAWGLELELGVKGLVGYQSLRGGSTHRWKSSLFAFGKGGGGFPSFFRSTFRDILDWTKKSFHFFQSTNSHLNFLFIHITPPKNKNP